MSFQVHCKKCCFKQHGNEVIILPARCGHVHHGDEAAVVAVVDRREVAEDGDESGAAEITITQLLRKCSQNIDQEKTMTKKATF